MGSQEELNRGFFNKATGLNTLRAWPMRGDFFGETPTTKREESLIAAPERDNASGECAA